MSIAELIYQKSLALNEATAKNALAYIQALLQQQSNQTSSNENNLDDLIGCLDDKTNGIHLSIEEINEAIAQAANDAAKI